jgi:hypothetical protein
MMVVLSKVQILKSIGLWGESEYLWDCVDSVILLFLRKSIGLWGESGVLPSW